jgi:hypothetical protein
VNGYKHFTIYYPKNVALLRTKDEDSSQKKLWIMGILEPESSGDSTYIISRYSNTMNAEVEIYKSNVSAYVREKWA